MTVLQRTATYIPSADRQLFTLLSLPRGEAKGIVVHVPPFAEEMNKSRRMLTLTTEALVEAGWMVVLFDLTGCGDSSGGLEDVSWEMWIEDLDNVIEWCAAAYPELELNLWCLRGGALIASDWLARNRRPCNAVLLWQPVLSGKLQLTQFLRLKAANSMLSEADARSAVAEIRKRLDQGQSVDIAGYCISTKFAKGMAGANLSVDGSGPRKLGVVEIGGGANGAFSPAIEAAIAKWESNGCRVLCEKVVGPAFWGTPYIRTVPELVHVSRRFLEQLQV